MWIKLIISKFHTPFIGSITRRPRGLQVCLVLKLSQLHLSSIRQLSAHTLGNRESPGAKRKRKVIISVAPSRRWRFLRSCSRIIWAILISWPPRPEFAHVPLLSSDYLTSPLHSLVCSFLNDFPQRSLLVHIPLPLTMPNHLEREVVPKIRSNPRTTSHTRV